MNAHSHSEQFTQPSHLVVLGHPDPKSFCATVARAYCEEIEALGQQVALRDLYALGFDPRLAANERSRDARLAAPADLARDIELLRGADVITLVYPIWFGLPPAIIKGYIDRVFGASFDARAIMDADKNRVLSGKRLMLFSSSASTRPWLEEKGQWVALRQAFEAYLRNIFGLRDAGHTHFDSIMPGVNQRLVDECLAVMRERARVVAAEVLGEKRARQSLEIRHRA